MLVGEVIPVAISYLRDNPASDQIDKYKVILVDEYQDLNRGEQEFIRLIKGDADIVVVGDDDQSIYGFKYAHPEGIQELKELYGDYADIPFDECRRCPQQVTRMASELISKNSNRTLGVLNPRPENNEGIVQVIQWKTYDDEISGLTKIIIKELEAGSVKPEDILILAPRRKIGYRLRDSLLSKGLPVKSYFREQAISKDTVRRAYSLLNLFSNPEDLISLRYLLGYSSTEHRKSQYSKLKALAADKNISLRDVLDKILSGEIKDTSLKTIVNEYRRITLDLAKIKAIITSKPDAVIRDIFIKGEEDETEFYEFDQLYRKAAYSAL